LLNPWQTQQEVQMKSANRTVSCNSAEVNSLTNALSRPFQPAEVKFKPAMVSGNRALALAYVDARVIQDRLDEVLGVDGWQDDYECLPDGSVVCRLRLRLGDEWITKVDVGGPSEQPDGGDRLKAAFSDALKRAAVKFGIGRYLYRLPSQWLDYDSQRRQFLKTPVLPKWAFPAPAGATGVSTAPAGAPATPASPARLSPHPMPANGPELQRRLYDYDARLAEQGICRPGDLVKHVVQAGLRYGYDSDLSTWSGPALSLAIEETKAFEARARGRGLEAKEVA
jgi:Rad52/22 family double-strand break repair protein